MLSLSKHGNKKLSAAIGFGVAWKLQSIKEHNADFGLSPKRLIIVPWLKPTAKVNKIESSLPFGFSQGNLNPARNHSITKLMVSFTILGFFKPDVSRSFMEIKT